MTIVKLDPLLVARCRHTDFAVDYYSSSEFLKLKKSIAHTGGNIEPIKVRSTPEGGHEIIFGHARLQACFELGLSVSVVIDEMQDRELVEQFMLHQAFKSKPSPWRLAAVISGALDSGLFPSIRRISEALGLPLSQLAPLARLDYLPDRTKEALKGKFLSPRAIKKLIAEYEADPAKHLGVTS